MLIDEQRLFELTPTGSGSFNRAVLLGEEIRDLLMFDSQDTVRASRCTVLRADLEHFASGKFVTCRLSPDHRKSALLARLDPPKRGIFEIRCQEPRPGLRILGGFPCKDTFVALTWAPRSVAVPWSRKKPLKNDAKAWRRIVKNTQKQWKDLFAEEFAPLEGDNIHDIISENFDLV